MCWSAIFPLAQASDAEWESLNHQYSELSSKGQHFQALAAAQKALSLAETRFGAEHIDTMLSVGKLALAYEKVGQYEQALPLQLRALSYAEQFFGPEHFVTAESLNNLALTYNKLGEFSKVQPLQVRALAISEEANGPDHPVTAEYLKNLAYTYNILAEYEKALPLQTRALAIIEKTNGPMHPQTARVLNDLASTYFDLVQYAKAMPLQARALTISEGVNGPDHPDTALGLGNLAHTLSFLGQYEKALPLQKRALEITEKSYGPAHPFVSDGLVALALTYNHLQQYRTALPLQLRALSVSEKSLGSVHPGTANILTNLALTYGALDQGSKALPLLRRSLTINEKLYGPVHLRTAQSLGILAMTHCLLAQCEKALPLQLRALSIFEATNGPDDSSAISARVLLALIFVGLNDPESAVPMYKAAINSLQSQRENISQIGKDEFNSYTQSIAYAYQNFALLLTEQGRLPEAQQVLDMLKEDEQFDFIRRSNDADPRSTRIGYNATEQAFMTRYRQIADRLAALGAEEQALRKKAKLGLTPAEQQRLKALTADLKVAEQAFTVFMTGMREDFKIKGSARAVELVETSEATTRGLQTILKDLGPDVALLRYFVTEDKVGMLLTLPGVQIARSSAVSAKELNRQIFQLRGQLADPKSKPLPLAQSLYKLLLGPLEDDLAQANIKTVMVSLDGTLRYLPMAALHDGKQYALERWNLPIYTSVAKAKLRDAISPQWQAAGLGVTKAHGRFKPLPSVQEEMGSIVRTAVGSAQGLVPGEVYLDEAFDAQRLKDVGQRPFNLVHVASHFQFSPGTEVNSFLLLGDGQQLTLGDLRTQNYRFDHVDLLTLSACDTGLGGGRDEKGREIEGFGVLAQQQGAKAVLATLWPVADKSTSILMADMYSRRQNQQLSKIEALRQAQRALMQQPKYQHPFYWAPFILMGNWK